MDVKTTSAAAPFFFVFLFLALMGLEYLIARYRGQKVYEFHDFYTNVGCSLGQQVFEVLSQAAMVGCYFYLYEHFALIKSEITLINFLIALVLVDLAYYTLHRIMHRVSVFWAIHVVHHQSKQFNLSLGLRLSWIHKLLTFPIYLPLAIFGVNPKIFLAAGAVEIFYQFCSHTQVVRRIPVFELVFVTPSHHRVHHGAQEKFLNQNFGGILNVWDRVFGTFQLETEPPIFGTQVPFEIRNSFYATGDFWIQMRNDFRSRKSIGSLVTTLFQPPEYCTGKTSEATERILEAPKEDLIFTPAYIVVNYIFMITMTLGFILHSQKWGWWQRLPGVAVILFSLYSLGNCQDQNSKARTTEIARAVFTISFLVYYFI